MKILLKVTMILSLASLSIAKEVDPLNLDKILVEKENLNKLFGIGFGIGNPITNIILSFPYVDIDFGYGGFNGLHPNNFTPYLIFGIDVLFREELYHNIIMAGGVGVGVDWSPVKSTDSGPAGAPEEKSDNKEGEFLSPASNNRLGIVLRLPISLEYSFLKNLVIGFKGMATIGGTMLISPITFEGARFGFFGIAFIKIYI
ncbi:DUF3996 domain-containing protein [Candidatus Borreliella tachyglossi]|uniref:DUF3996 domain-containing protein n=1 Tax=Candidatus Borreliella tachyglossi TaxID=1964448 RepID=UPI0040422AEF